MNALLLVDIQNDFLPGGAMPVKEGNAILPIVNDLLERSFDQIIATKDWHPENHGSFASTHHKQPGEHVLLGGEDQVLWPIHCVQNTQGSEFSNGWQSHLVKKIFYKGTDPTIDSYSTFFDNGHRKSTGLEVYLKENGVKNIYIAGLATDYCVKYSVLDALHLGFQVYVISDACRGINLNEKDEQNAFEEMHQAGAKILSSKEIDF